MDALQDALNIFLVKNLLNINSKSQL